VVTDEVYEHLVFDGSEHVPIATLPGMAERTLSISSSGKTFSFTGWKIGWATGPAELVAAVEGAKNWLSFASGAPLQPAIAHALTHEFGFPRALRADLQGKRDLLCEGLGKLDVNVRVPEGTYFVTTDVRRLGWPDGRAFCLALPERAGVVAIPSQGFYDDKEEGRHLVRWAFCKTEDVIREGLARLAGADLVAR
jgi:N-succinyldiaminopimelate aminotransferase